LLAIGDATTLGRKLALMPRLALMALVVVMLSLSGPLVSPALAISCKTSPSSGTINGNLTVPANTSMLLHNTTVTGNVVMQPGSDLELCGGVTISGNLSGTNIGTLRVTEPNNRISGALTINGGVQVTIAEASIVGAVSLQGITINYAVVNNTIGGTTTVNANPTVGTRLLAANHIGGPLRCSGNTPGPTGAVGLSKNTVVGGKFGQCASL
jgi:hexosaminidase